MEELYVKATQDGIVRLKYNTTPTNIAGLYTEGLETCNALILCGEKGITLIHDTNYISDVTLSNEIEAVGKIDSWDIASNPAHTDLQELQKYTGRLITLGLKPEQCRHYPNLNQYYKATGGFISVSREKKVNVTSQPSKFVNPLNEDKRHRINIFNNFFSKYIKNFVPGDVQYDGIELSDCSTLIFAFRQMRDFALADNNPENILGSLKYYLEKYEPKELKEMEKEELVEHYKKSMNIKKMATELKQKRGGSIANTEYKASVLIQNVNSRLHDSGKICARLQDITPGKVWKVNLKNNIAWLELNDINEAKDIVVHFNTHGYSNIKLEFKKNTTIPLVWINFINFEKLEKIPQMSLLQNQNFLTRKPNI